MSYETVGVVRLRPDATWAQALALYHLAANPTSHHFEVDDDRFIGFDPDQHEIQYSLDYESIRDVEFLDALQALALTGWASELPAEEPHFFGPNPSKAALRYWIRQRDHAQEMLDVLS